MNMLPKTRLILGGVIIFGSLVYAIIVAVSPEVASALMLGYVGILLTIFVATQVWKRGHDQPRRTRSSTR